ncbi:MAG: hypothetical protein ACTSWW_13480 [Promethearchaeota archaeon]
MKSLLLSDGDQIPQGLCHAIICVGTGWFTIRDCIPDRCLSIPGRIIQGPLAFPSYATVECDPEVSLVVYHTEAENPSGGIYREFPSDLPEFPVMNGYIQHIDLVSPAPVAGRNLVSLSNQQERALLVDSQPQRVSFRAAFPSGIASGDITNRVLTFHINLPLDSLPMKCQNSFIDGAQRIGMLVVPDQPSNPVRHYIGTEIESGEHKITFPESGAFPRMFRIAGLAESRARIDSVCGRIQTSELILSEDLTDMTIAVPRLNVSVSNVKLSASHALYVEVAFE